MREAVGEFSRRKPIDEAVWADFASRLHYVVGPVRGRRRTSCAFARSSSSSIARNGTRGNRIYYLAIPPSVFRPVNDNLAAAGMVAEERGNFARIIIEKPFGHDLASAEALNADLHRVLAERQIFRIDHYLGKETVQNLVALRFGNAIFEPLWNRNHIDHVQITVAEDIGVEGRGKFYEEAGASRDIVQNHLLQLLMVAAMEPPVAFTADEVRDEKVKVLRALRPIRRRRRRRASPCAGSTGPATSRASRCPGTGRSRTSARRRTSRRSSPCASRSTTGASPGVPIYIRAGKRLAKRTTEISVHFKRVPHALLATTSSSRVRRGRATGLDVEPDVLAIRIQPDEGIGLRFVAKVPGPSMTLRPVTMDFRYGSTFGGSGPEAYERLILDAMLGDPTLFARADEVTAAWRFMTPDPRRRGSRSPPPDFPNYAGGDVGPAGGVRPHRARRARLEAAVRLSLDAVEPALAQLWEEEADRGGAPRIELFTLVALVSELALLGRAQTGRRGGRARVPFAHDRRRRGRQGADRRDHRRGVPAPRLAPEAPRAATPSCSRPPGARASGCPRTSTASRCPTCPSASGGSATCPTSTTSSTAWSSTPTWSSSTRARWICATSRSSRRSSGAAAAAHALSDLTWIRLRPIQDLIARFFDDETARACLSLDRAHHDRVRAARGRAGRGEHPGRAPLRLDGERAVARRRRRVAWKRGAGWAEATLGRVVARFDARPRADVPTGSILRVPIECDGARFEVERQDDPQVFRWSREAPGAPVPPQTLRIGIPEEATLLVRCLERPKRDPLLEKSLHVGEPHRAPRGAAAVRSIGRLISSVASIGPTTWWRARMIARHLPAPGHGVPVPFLFHGRVAIYWTNVRG